MIDLTGVKHHPAIDEIVEVLCNKTQNTDKSFFRVETAYFLGKMASSMRATIVTKDRGDIPVNIYALALATSGYGKGHSVHVIENEFCRGFKKRLMEDTLPLKAEEHLWKLANERALRHNTDPQVEYDALNNDYRRSGAYPFTFDSGTSPAVKQLRHKLLLADAGSINLQIDEIGSNLISQTEVLNLFLELYDQGIVKQKLVKNTVDNQRGEDLDGKTPTNMLLFGTPIKLFDGSSTEEQFFSFLEIGFARRCFFGAGQQDRRAYNTMTPAEIYANSILPQNNTAIQKWSQHFHKLADPGMFGWRMELPDDVAIQLLTYKFACEEAAEAMPEHEEIKKAELGHRYFKALKLAGAFAFVDESLEIEMSHLMSAILLTEESGAGLSKILSREPTYVKLARFMAQTTHEVTHADLMESLPFFKKGAGARNEMMSLAIAWGYKQHIIIKKSYGENSIEFFKGETLRETDIDKMQITYSPHWAYHNQTEEAPFSDLHEVTQAMQPDGEPYHWANHAFKNGHRSEENTVPGFNLIVIDVDGGVKLPVAHELLKEVKFMTYTTKRHTEDEHRFRLILPINYYLELDGDEYKEFMNAIMSWLPFKTDPGANQRSKKWETFNGSYHYNMDGAIFDALPFIPKTSRNESWRKDFSQIENMDNLERWFAGQMTQGQRNNQMIRYALALVDTGMNFMEVQNQVLSFNSKLSQKLTETEIMNTIMQTVAKHLAKK